MHSIYVIYTNFCTTNLQILDSIWVVIAQMFCMLPPTLQQLQPTIQHLVKKNFVIVDKPKYIRNTSVYCVTDYVCIILTTVIWVHK